MLFDGSNQALKQVLTVTTCVNEIMLPFYQTEPNHLPNMLSEFYKQVFLITGMNSIIPLSFMFKMLKGKYYGIIPVYVLILSLYTIHFGWKNVY